MQKRNMRKKKEEKGRQREREKQSEKQQGESEKGKKEVKEKKEKGERKGRAGRMGRKNEMGLLLENFVLLQKALSDLAISFKALEQKMQRFLELVEKASQIEAKEIGIKEVREIASESETKETKEVPSGLAEKIEELLEQNKAIAEGMTLLEKILRERLTK
jgi:hypothetical protein